MGSLESGNRRHINIRPINNETSKCNGGELLIFASKCLRTIVDKEEGGATGATERQKRKIKTRGEERKEIEIGKTRKGRSYTRSEKETKYTI